MLMLVNVLVINYRSSLVTVLASHETSNLVNQPPAVTAFEYLSVLISIVLALGMTRVLAGVGEMLQARMHRRIYWVHVIWTLNLFIYLVVEWWIFYRWRNQQEWTFFLFVFVLIAPTLLYLASMLLFPREGTIDESIDYKEHYYANHRAFFAIFSMFTLVDIADTLLKGIPHFLALGKPYVVSSMLYFVGMVTAAITQNRRYHQFYAVFFLVQTIVISFILFQVLV
jgi:hypothetical protein